MSNINWDDGNVFADTKSTKVGTMGTEDVSSDYHQYIIYNVDVTDSQVGIQSLLLSTHYADKDIASSVKEVTVILNPDKPSEQFFSTVVEDTYFHSANDQLGLEAALIPAMSVDPGDHIQVWIEVFPGDISDSEMSLSGIDETFPLGVPTGTPSGQDSLTLSKTGIPPDGVPEFSLTGIMLALLAVTAALGTFIYKKRKQ
jgi:hypothetical protein